MLPKSNTFSEAKEVDKSYKELYKISKVIKSYIRGDADGQPIYIIIWEKRAEKTLEDILPEYDQYLAEYVYEKIWSELSELDKKILTEISESGENRVKDLRERLKMKSELFSVYRDRLKRKGVIDTREYGKISLALPRFDEFVKLQNFD